MRMYIIALALTALIAGGIWIAKSNFDGVCIWTGKRLTDRQKLELAFTRVNYAFRAVDEKGHTLETAPKYESLDEYLKLYPDCCSIKWLGKKKAHSWPEPTFWQRVSGDYAFGVEVVYWRRVQKLDGTSYLKRVEVHPYFTNCGALSPNFDHDG